MIKLTIPGVPNADERPRKGKYGSIYDPKSNEKKAVKILLKRDFKGKIYVGPLSVTLRFFFLRPKSHFTKGGDLKKSAPRSMFVKPDIDNLIKFVLDCMNDIVYKDDKQIDLIVASKRYGDPRTEIVISGD